MSNSRLEKFIYAICGMEVDDLPTPLSRIETLWDCLITGETPDFEPLSRNEKYLMSMLTGDVDALPEPTSRSEKLLYKIATGETDLTDVPGYLSRYEELLKYLIENGGFGGTDFEYVLYTLNQPLSTLYTTAEGPVKSAILSGQTLVNLVVNSRVEKIVGGSSGTQAKYDYIYQLENNKEYTIQFEISNFSATQPISCSFDNGWNTVDGMMIDKNGIYKTKFSTKNLKSTQVWFYWEIPIWEDGNSATVKNIIVLEGDYTNVDIPYFEGMQSVKMPVLYTRNNLFNGNMEIGSYDITTGGNSVISNMRIRCVDFIPISNTNNIMMEIINSPRTDDLWILQYDSSKNYLGIGNAFNIPKGVNQQKLNLVSNCAFIKFYEVGISGLDLGIEYIISDKTNILTTPSDLELRGIGDVRDELDCLTGQVTERIGEVVLDGSEDWNPSGNNANLSNINYIQFYWKNSSSILKNKRSMFMCDKIVVKPFSKWVDSWNDMSLAESFVVLSSNNELCIRVPFTYLNEQNVNGFKSWLSQNPITIQYQLTTESIKTIVLSTLDQDGQPTKLSTFNDITHVSIEAEDLLPTVDLEVATKIEETLSSLPTQMIDISETQQSLNEKIDEQAENINEVSAAMTEIRNDIL